MPTLKIFIPKRKADEEFNAYWSERPLKNDDGRWQLAVDSLTFLSICRPSWTNKRNIWNIWNNGYTSNAMSVAYAKMTYWAYTRIYVSSGPTPLIGDGISETYAKMNLILTNNTGDRHCVWSIPINNNLTFCMRQSNFNHIFFKGTSPFVTITTSV